MARLTFPDGLPDCTKIDAPFTNNFSGWQLGMGVPDILTGLLHGLSVLSKDKPDCIPVAFGMGLWGIQAHPLAPAMAAWTLPLMDAGLKVDPSLGALAARLAAAPQLDDNDSEHMDTWYALARQDNHALIIRFMTVLLADPAKGLRWLGHCWQDLIYLGVPEIPKAALDMIPWTKSTLPLKARMEADWAFHCLPPEESFPIIEALDPKTWGLWRAYAGAELLLRMGETDEAKTVLGTLWKTLPWHVNLTLKLYDIFNPVPLADISDAKDAAILLYSWNKADLLADTLDSLADSDIGQAKIFALNNGSTDHTAEVLEKAQAQFGADRFHVETLPINVGAPAARNWLLALPEVRACKWAAYLDDDIILPKEWLLHLLGAANGQPNVGAVGCRITAATSPFGLQSADFNLFPMPPGQTEPGTLPNRVLIYDNCAGGTDYGLFTYTRPCLSVTGCCHMISLEAVEKAGGFDLRYTPSQFDDLDRDLRSALHGMPAIYTGTLAIKHVQHSSLAKSQTHRQIGHVMGNKFKLDTKYTDEELAALAKDNNQRLRADLQTKYDFLIDHLA